VDSFIGPAPSLRLTLSSVAAVVAYFFGVIAPNKRPFSVANPDISFPHKDKETVTLKTLVLAALVAPAVVILLVVLVFVPGPTAKPSTPKSLVWQRKLWEWFTGWTGLALSLASATIITNGKQSHASRGMFVSNHHLAIKNLCGHWRPDLLARCQPDIANLGSYAVGGYINTTDGVYLVSAAACQTTDSSLLNDGFRSFPSGHASFSAAGLIYLSLFLASKLAITVPSLAPRAFSSHYSGYSAFPSRSGPSEHDLGHQGSESAAAENEPPMEMHPYAKPSGHGDAEVAVRDQAAAPPLYLLVIACIPFFTAIYISATRYYDFRHHGFDILFGFSLGTVTAVFSFRWYHLPISKGAGWSWGLRSRDHAFWSGVGVGTYASSHPDHELSELRPNAPDNDDLRADPRVLSTHGSGLLEGPSH
jgi:membrane-associated phospholipid phosphatase